MTSTLSLSLVPSIILSSVSSVPVICRNAKSWEELLLRKAMLHTGAEPRIKQRKLGRHGLKLLKLIHVINGS